MKKIVHIITGLNQGGAEMMLLKLLRTLSNNRSCDIHVISLMNSGQLGAEIENLGITVHSLNMSRNFGFFSALRKGLTICKEADILQTWMYHADLFGYIMKLFNNKARLIWGIRQSNLDPALNTSRTLLIARLNGWLSKTPLVNCIVTNSERAAMTHSRVGYDSSKFIVIPNGFDMNLFGKESMETARLKLGFDREHFLVVTVGRWDPQKGYPTLLKSLRESFLFGTAAKMIMCGAGLDEKNDELMTHIRSHGLEDQIVLLGRRSDVTRILSACDVFISSSYGEGFSNAIGEAMASGLPCIVTDVGDSRRIIGDTGWLVPPKNSNALSEALSEAYQMNRDQRHLVGNRAKDRINSCFGIESISEQYQQLYQL